MRVKVSGIDIDPTRAYTPQGGDKLRALIEPALVRGEPVELDFEGVQHFSAVFFWSALGALIEADTADRLPGLLRVENLHALGQGALDSVRDLAVRRRENPRWAEAMGRIASKYAERE